MNHRMYFRAPAPILTPNKLNFDTSRLGAGLIGHQLRAAQAAGRSVGWLLQPEGPLDS